MSLPCIVSGEGGAVSGKELSGGEAAPFMTEVSTLERNRRNRRRRKLTGKLLHPEVANRRKQAGGRRSAEMIKAGEYRMAVPGKKA